MDNEQRNRMEAARTEVRRTMVLLVLIGILLAAVLAAGAVRFGRRDERTIRTERVAPVPTSVPAADPTDAEDPVLFLHEVVVWARYDVPLDDELQRYIGRVCRDYEVDTAVVMALIEAESGCDPNLITDGEDFGLMQVRATEHTERCIRLGCWNLLDPKQNVRCGVDFLAELLACGHGIEWALSWYNGHGGEPCEYAWTVLTEAERLMESVTEGIELRACPFCGGTAVALAIFHRNAPSRTTPWYAKIQCTKCLADMGMPGPLKTTREQAVRDAAEL